MPSLPIVLRRTEWWQRVGVLVPGVRHRGETSRYRQYGQVLLNSKADSNHCMRDHGLLPRVGGLVDLGFYRPLSSTTFPATFGRDGALRVLA